jgi:cytochrome c oxidase assembly factor CtaG
MYRLAWEIPQNRAQLFMAVVGAGVAWCTSRGERPSTARLSLAATLVSLIPLLVAGHAATASNHYVAAQSLVVHVFAASLWAGGLMVMVLHLRKDTDTLSVALPAFSRLAFWCFVAVALSGVVGAWIRLGTSWYTWTSTYGALVAAKSAALTFLGLLGAAHRRWSLPRVQRLQRHAFARLAVVETLVMTVSAAMAVVLARTPPPAEALTRTTPPHANTFPTVDRGLGPVSPWSLLSESRPDVWVTTLAAVVLIGYLWGIREVGRRGTAWPLRRTACFGAAVAVAVWAMCGGLGSYSTALFSAEVARLLTMGLVVPCLLVGGGPVTLCGMLRTGFARWAVLARRVSPVNGLVVLVVALAAALMTPLLEISLRSQALHTAVAGVVLGAGWFFFWSLLGGDGAPTGKHDAADAALLLVILAVLLLVQAGHIWASSTLFAADWFSGLDWWWGDAHADQRRAGLVASGFALAVLAGVPWCTARRRLPSRAPSFPKDHSVR